MFSFFLEALLKCFSSRVSKEFRSQKLYKGRRSRQKQSSKAFSSSALFSRLNPQFTRSLTITPAYFTLQPHFSTCPPYISQFLYMSCFSHHWTCNILFPVLQTLVSRLIPTQVQVKLRLPVLQEADLIKPPRNPCHVYVPAPFMCFHHTFHILVVIKLCNNLDTYLLHCSSPCQTINSFVMFQKSSYNINQLLWKDYFKRGGLILAVTVGEEHLQGAQLYIHLFSLACPFFAIFWYFLKTVVKYSPGIFEKETQFHLWTSFNVFQSVLC